VLGTACDSASIASPVSKWRPFRFSSIGETEKSRAGGDDSHIVFGKKIPWLKRKCETVYCRDATASYFVAKVPGEVFAHFYAVPVKRYSSIGN
jgi:hypothetical protein